MNIYILLSKIFPESRLKDRLRIILYTYFKNEALLGYNRKYQLKKGDIVIDAGAFPGEYALYAAKKIGDKGKVICFEPDPFNYKALCRITEKSKNIVVINKGLWSRERFLNISGENQSATIDSKGSSQIEVTALDNELEKLGIRGVNFIKMDIEGAEIEAIDGMFKTLQYSDTHLAIASYHIVNGKKTCYVVEQKLTAMGYEVSTGYPKHLTTYGSKKNLSHRV
jgi:FkbM family methyltransferase